jgi:hypothetical protein
MLTAGACTLLSPRLEQTANSTWQHLNSDPRQATE